VASGLANKVRYEGFDPERAHVALSALPRFVAEFFPAAPLLPDALTLSLKLEHALYDCLYLVLALAQKARVLTADRAFAHSASRGGYQQHVELLTWT
jgi:predicted nucleic acid-binding protein